MKKCLKIALLSLSSTLMAGEVGLELGIQKIEIDGDMQYKGTSIDLRKDLGLREKENAVKPTLTYTSNNKRHKFLINYEGSEYQANEVLTRNIIFNDKVYTIGSNITTSIETNWYQVGYRYTFDSLFRNKLVLKVGSDLNIIDLKASIDTIGISENYDVIAPLPTLVLEAEYEFLNNLSIEGKVAAITLGNYGDYSEYYAGLKTAIPYVYGLAIKAGYMAKNIEIEIESDEKFELEYTGTYIGLEYKF